MPSFTDIIIIKICPLAYKAMFLFSKSSRYFSLNCGGHLKQFLPCCWSVGSRISQMAWKIQMIKQGLNNKNMDFFHSCIILTAIIYCCRVGTFVPEYLDIGIYIGLLVHCRLLKSCTCFGVLSNFSLVKNWNKDFALNFALQMGYSAAQ